MIALLQILALAFGLGIHTDGGGHGSPPHSTGPWLAPTHVRTFPAQWGSEPKCDGRC